MSGAVSGFQPQDLRELDSVCNSVDKYAAGIQTLSDTFKDSSNLKLWWDSKVPKKDRSWYYFSNLTPSNSQKVLDEMKKYQEFYKYLKAAISKTKQGDADSAAYQMMIKDLEEKLSEMIEAAKREEYTTSSSTVYELHRSFIKEHEKLKNMIDRTQLVGVRDGWNKSTQTINNLEDKLNKYEEQFDEMKEDLSECQEKLLEQNQEKQKLLEENKIMKKNQEELYNSLQKMKHEMLLDKEKFNVMKEDLSKCQEKLSEQNQEKQKLLEDNKIMKKNQEELYNSLQKMKHEMLLDKERANKEREEFFECINQLKEQQNKKK